MKISSISMFTLLLFVLNAYSLSLHAQQDTSVYSIQLIGDANTLNTLSESGKTPANASVGLLYTKYFRIKKESDTRRSKLGKFLLLHSAEVGINFNIASTVDTLKAVYQNSQMTSKSSFGNSILTPGNSGQSSFFNVKAYFGEVSPIDSSLGYADRFGFISGFYTGFNHASRNWYDSSKNIKSSTIALSVGFFYDFIDYKARDLNAKKVKSVYAGVGYTARWIVGDIALDENDNFRKNLLGTNKTSFHGIEFTLGAKIENARIELKIPMFFGKQQVAGLTATQPFYQIGFSGGITIK